MTKTHQESQPGANIDSQSGTPRSQPGLSASQPGTAASKPGSSSQPDLGHTVPLKSKLPLSHETRLSSREARVSSRESLKKL